jgi:hypothetical protein
MIQTIFARLSWAEMPMYCPQCLTDYRDGFSECADCRVRLVAGTPPERPSHCLDAIPVFETREIFGFHLAAGALEEAGIEFAVEGDDPRTDPSSWTGLVGPTPFAGKCHCRILVRSEDVARARDILEPIREREDKAE